MAELTVPHSALCAYVDKDGRCRGMADSVIVHVANRGEFFATRESARRLIGEETGALPEREAVILDWTGVQAVTGAFAGELAKWCLSTARRVASTAMNEDVRRTYETAMRRLRRNRAALRSDGGNGGDG